MNKYILYAAFLIFAASPGQKINNTPSPPQALPVVKINPGKLTTLQKNSASLNEATTQQKTKR